jgi:acyl carrier protein
MNESLIKRLSDLLRIINEVRYGGGKPLLSTIGASTRLRDELEFDSLDLAELTVRIQAEYQVDVFAKRNLHTVGDILDQL